MHVQEKLVIGVSIALLTANAGALAQTPRESPPFSYEQDNTISALLRSGWEIKAAMVSPSKSALSRPGIILQKGGQAAWCDLQYEVVPPPDVGVTGNQIVPSLKTSYCREIK